MTSKTATNFHPTHHHNTAIADKGNNEYLGSDFEPLTPIPVSLRPILLPSRNQPSPSDLHVILGRYIGPVSSSPSNQIIVTNNTSNGIVNNNNNSNGKTQQQQQQPISQQTHMVYDLSTYNELLQKFKPQLIPITSLFRFPIPQYSRFQQHQNHHIPINPKLFSNTGAFAFSFSLYTQTAIYNTIYRDAVSSMSRVNHHNSTRCTKMAIIPLSNFHFDKPVQTEKKDVHKQHPLSINHNAEILQIIDESETAMIPSLSLSSEVPLLYSAMSSHEIKFYTHEQPQKQQYSHNSGSLSAHNNNNNGYIKASNSIHGGYVVPTAINPSSKPFLPGKSNQNVYVQQKYDNFNNSQQQQQQQQLQQQLQGQQQQDIKFSQLVETRSLQSTTFAFTPFTENLSAQIEEEEHMIEQLQIQGLPVPVKELPSFDEIYINSPQLQSHHLPLLSELAASSQEQLTSIGSRVLATAKMSTNDWMLTHFPTIIEPMAILHDLFSTCYYLNVPVSSWEIISLRQQTKGLPFPITPTKQMIKDAEISRYRDYQDDDDTQCNCLNGIHYIDCPNKPITTITTPGSVTTSTTFVTTSHPNPNTQKPSTLINSYLQSFLPSTNSQFNSLPNLFFSNQRNKNSLANQFTFSTFSNLAGVSRIPQLTRFRSILSGDLVSPPTSILHLPRPKSCKYVSEKHLRSTMAKMLADVYAKDHGGLISTRDAKFSYLKLLHRSTQRDSNIINDPNYFLSKIKNPLVDTTGTIVHILPQAVQRSKQGYDENGNKIDLSTQTTGTAKAAKKDKKVDKKDKKGNTNNTTNTNNPFQNNNNNDNSMNKKGTNPRDRFGNPEWYDDLVFKNYPPVKQLVDDYSTSTSLLVYTVPVSIMIGDIFPTLNLIASRLQFATINSINETHIGSSIPPPIQTHQRPLSSASSASQQYHPAQSPLPQHDSQQQPQSGSKSPVQSLSMQKQALLQQAQQASLPKPPASTRPQPFSQQPSHQSRQSQQQQQSPQAHSFRPSSTSSHHSTNSSFFASPQQTPGQQSSHGHNIADQYGPPISFEKPNIDQLETLEQLANNQTLPSSISFMPFDDTNTFNPTLMPGPNQERENRLQQQQLIASSFDDVLSNSSRVSRLIDNHTAQSPNNGNNNINNNQGRSKGSSDNSNNNSFQNNSSVTPSSMAKSPKLGSSKGGLSYIPTTVTTQTSAEFQQQQQLQNQPHLLLQQHQAHVNQQLTHIEQQTLAQQRELQAQFKPLLYEAIDNICSHLSEEEQLKQMKTCQEKQLEQLLYSQQPVVIPQTDPTNPISIVDPSFGLQQAQYQQQKEQIHQLTSQFHNYYYNYTFEEIDRIVTSLDIIVDYLSSYRYCLMKRGEYLSKLQNTLLAPFVALCSQQLLTTKLELKTICNDINTYRRDIEQILTQIETTRTALSTSVSLELQKASTIDRLTTQLTKLRESRLNVMKSLDHACQLKASKEQQYDLLKMVYSELVLVSTSASNGSIASSSASAVNSSPSQHTGLDKEFEMKQPQARSFHRCEHALRSEYLLNLFGNTNSVMFLYNLSVSFLLRLEWIRTTNKCVVINHTIEQLLLRQHDIISMEWL